MLIKTRGILLRTLKFQESSLIVSLYTRDHGPVDLIAKGVRSSRSTRQGMFQLLHELEIVYQDKAGRELHPLRDVGLIAPYRNLTSQPHVVLYGLLVGEVFYRAVREQEPNPELYTLLLETLHDLDQRSHNRYAVTLWFLLQLTRYLGCFPLVQPQGVAPGMYFDLHAGVLQPASSNNEPEAYVLAQLAQYTTREDAAAYVVPQQLRAAALRQLLRFVGTHVEGFRQPLSLEVFEAVFRDE